MSTQCSNYDKQLWSCILWVLHDDWTPHNNNSLSFAEVTPHTYDTLLRSIWYLSRIYYVILIPACVLPVSDYVCMIFFRLSRLLLCCDYASHKIFCNLRAHLMFVVSDDKFHLRGGFLCSTVHIKQCISFPIGSEDDNFPFRAHQPDKATAATSLHS